MYDFLEKNLPKECIVEVNNDLLIANPEHKWGLASFHYIDEYYIELIEVLKRMCKNLDK